MARPRSKGAAGVPSVESGAGIRHDSIDSPAERTLPSDQLLQGRNHISIIHNGERYQLRATRLGKLILTK